ncbi:MAG: thioesterase family protein [Actinomycetota bacterium]|nr:thioesterase family protein [Actinomycetota bacterium]
MISARTGGPTRAELGRLRLDPLIAGLCRSATHLTAGVAAARAVLDAGIDIGFGHWIHSVSVSILDTRLGSGDLRTEITQRETAADRGFRAVASVADDRTLAHSQVLFEAPYLGAHQDAATATSDTPGPHRARAVASSRWAAGLPVDIREMPGAGRAWVRFDRELPDDLLVHTAALALIVDRVIAYGMRDAGDHQPTGYDLRIHRCFRADDWILVNQRYSRVFGARAFSTYTLSTSLGREIATASQEVRLSRAGAKPWTNQSSLDNMDAAVLAAK